MRKWGEPNACAFSLVRKGGRESYQKTHGTESYQKTHVLIKAVRPLPSTESLEHPTLHDYLEVTFSHIHKCECV